jgi:hypothetical protein
MKLFPNKSTQQKIAYDEEGHRQKAAQEHLDKLIDDICKDIGIYREKYTSEKMLLLAIINSPEAKLNSCWRKFAIYDSSYRLLKELNVSVSSRYAWFTNLKEYILQIKPN